MPNSVLFLFVKLAATRRTCDVPWLSYVSSRGPALQKKETIGTPIHLASLLIFSCQINCGSCEIGHIYLYAIATWESGEFPSIDATTILFGNVVTCNSDDFAAAAFGAA